MATRARRSFVRTLLVSAVALGAALSPAGASATIPCTTDPAGEFELQTASGRIQTPDGNSVFMWGFAKDPGSFQIPGPILCVTEGDTVTITLRNTLAENVSIVFPGQSGVNGVGAPGLFAAEAVPSGIATYSFVASTPGTYLYESGTNPHKQVQMGLYGALVVRPAMGPNFAYNDASTEFDPAREFLVLLHDIDPELHRAVDLGLPFDATTMHDRYWTINGRSFPDTIAANNVAYLPAQPYGALVRVRPYDPATNPLPALIRYGNAGLENHPLHPHGNHLRVIAQDGRLRGAGSAYASEQFTRTVASGQTYDLLFRWTNAEGWSPTHPRPVAVPSLRNLVFKDRVTWYSGSPYLGRKGSLPPGTTSYNRCGEYYFPWHSHALNEFQNFDEGFGGMATLLRVDPPVGQGTPSSCPPAYP